MHLPRTSAPSSRGAFIPTYAPSRQIEATVFAKVGKRKDIYSVVLPAAASHLTRLI